MLENRLDYSAENCSLMRTLKIVGERWTLLVLREAFLGLRRFDDFQRAIGCARNVLTARLERLVEHEILERVPYREPGMRRRDEYRLTKKGMDLATATIALLQWGDRYVADTAGPPVIAVHGACGRPVRALLACQQHGEVTPYHVRSIAGPGAKKIA
jgi:DNA-binding HxlR family transcriptional regulator